ncbi:phosphatidylinositol N-acetylglucosaminyltransferase subunit C [Geosmithia morbida]|uniref:Phosphatidylinositol N-acetylglucosaminyltransferase subunit C n=1 Tax=Geosmithia morbida TaxID=1094350 RepID=A0A9P5D5P1_9HYPO|nr:phosphatidylinositol N-acetylglucosaminyltransferase subunit C [Geosmithia morbida]KAF4124756.1 phosphatidylinositol N-acetylglucosaminyltransferase subunit C [Geosmithia morbida]
MPSNTDDDESEAPFPTLDYDGPPTFNSHLSPNDAFMSPPRRSGGTASARAFTKRMGGEHGAGRRRKRAWKKLMWVKQSCTCTSCLLTLDGGSRSSQVRVLMRRMATDPDNYTDQATFLENLQRNPRLKPYDFWPLVADSTVILQHVCSVIIFVVCFACIFQERVSPVSIVECSSVMTFSGWLLWERWVSEEEKVDESGNNNAGGGGTGIAGTCIGTGGGAANAIIGRSGSRRNRAASLRRPIVLQSQTRVSSSSTASSAPSSRPESYDASATSSSNHLPATTKITAPPPTAASAPATAATENSTPNGSQEALHQHQQAQGADVPLFEPEDDSPIHQRLGTIKSAALIYSTLLGLSPILKSLTRSTSSDSIWAMSFWLLAINIFFFDYSGGVGVKFPASLSTNAALMASTVLASRLPSTKQVFSITLFSIEVFGLFPVFRRYARHRSWRYHVILTVLLVLGAGLGVGLVMGEGKNGSPWSWKSGIVGMAVSVILSVLGTGGCSWWLIGLQKYKNEIHGPWDPARPIIMSRQRWDDR